MAKIGTKHPMTFALVGRATAYRNAAKNGLQNTPTWALAQCELSLVAAQLDDAATELDRLTGIEAERDAAQAKWKGCEGLQWVTCETCKGWRRVIAPWEYAEARDCSKCLGTGKRLRKVEGEDHAGPDAE